MNGPAYDHMQKITECSGEVGTERFEGNPYLLACGPSVLAQSHFAAGTPLSVRLLHDIRLSRCEPFGLILYFMGDAGSSAFYMCCKCARGRDVSLTEWARRVLLAQELGMCRDVTGHIISLLAALC
jgi:hypothetical protein